MASPDRPTVEINDSCPECGLPLKVLSQGMITYLAPIPWGYIWQRSQQLTSRLARVVPVLYVQPEPLKNVSLAQLGRALRRLRLHMARRSGPTPPPGLEVLAPPFLPVVGSPLTDRLNYMLMAKPIVGALHRHTPLPAPRILWCTRPTPLAQRLAETGEYTMLLYEMIDPVPATHPRARRLAEVERALISRADLVLCTSEPLMEHARRLNANPHLLPNGVDPDHFGDGVASRDRGKAPLASLTDPIAGFYGTIGHWIDLPLLAFMAERLPQVQFVLIGPIEVPRGTLPQRQNLHWLGARDYRELPAYASRFSVCLLPFRNDEFTRGRNPGKLFEYFATGKPVVSTALPEVEAFGDLVYVGNDREGFLDGVQSALREDDGKRERRRAAALANTWESRVAAILHCLHQRLVSLNP